MRPIQLVASLLALSSLASAWPEPALNKAALQKVNGQARRQDNSQSEEPTPTTNRQGNRPSNVEATPTNDQTSREGSRGGTTLSMGFGPSRGSSSETVSGDTPEETEYGPDTPAGAIQMIEPAPTAAPSYYKIGDWVTFQWNYTAVSVTPSAIDILASCSACQGATYTIALNQTVEPTGRVLWDTGSYQKTAERKLQTEVYTLIIYDAQSSITAVPKPGHLGVFRQFTFGMYIPRDPVDFEHYKCAACSSATSSAERQTMTVLFGMATVTIFSFTWFAGSFGIF